MTVKAVGSNFHHQLKLWEKLWSFWTIAIQDVLNVVRLIPRVSELLMHACVEYVLWLFLAHFSVAGIVNVRCLIIQMTLWFNVKDAVTGECICLGINFSVWIRFVIILCTVEFAAFKIHLLRSPAVVHSFWAYAILKTELILKLFYCSLDTAFHYMWTNWYHVICAKRESRSKLYAYEPKSYLGHAKLETNPPWTITFQLLLNGLKQFFKLAYVQAVLIS